MARSRPLRRPVPPEPQRQQKQADREQGRSAVADRGDEPGLVRRGDLPRPHRLEDAGHLVTLAASGKEALELVAKQEFDLLFLDLKMPGMDGADVYQQIRAHKPRLPVVIITGYPDSDIMAKALAQGPFGVMNKPFGESDILGATRNFLRISPKTVENQFWGEQIDHFFDGIRGLGVHQPDPSDKFRNRQAATLVVSAFPDDEVVNVGAFPVHFFDRPVLVQNFSISVPR
jgi:CheY-like chemotaxis protein